MASDNDIASGQVGRMWRSLELHRPSDPAPGRTDEFADGASRWPPGLDRREFLRLMGASLALGGLSGCVRPNGTLVPYVTPPEDALPGSATYYATAIPVEGFARGILVESNLGRPTKIEGNPEHPESAGATDALTQAAILSLYDPDRSRQPVRRGGSAGWDAFDAELAARRARFTASRGRGLALLTEPTTSPTLLRELGILLATHPGARWYQHTALSSYAVRGVQPDYHFGKAKVVLFIGSDCLFRHPACLRYSREFAAMRRAGQGMMPGSRVYAIEPTPTLTGAMADFRLAASPARTRVLLDALARALENENTPDQGLSTAEAAFVAALARDLKAHGADALCVAGSEEDTAVREWALALNVRMGALGRTLTLLPSHRSDADPRSAGGTEDLAAALRTGAVEELFILGANPVYTSRSFRAAAAELGRVPFSVHVGANADETGSLCTWHLPEAHFLEAWGDLRAYDGTATVMQPLIEPLFGGRSTLEVLHAVHDPAPAGSYALVRATWAPPQPDPGFEARWARWLKAGVGEDAPQAPAVLPPEAAQDLPVLGGAAPADGLTLVLVPDATVLDGRWSNNAWLQELPKPLTQLVWDNAALISPSLASRLEVENGDLLLLAANGASIEAAAWIMPGQAADCVTLSLGYGRTRAGTVGDGRGFDATPLRRDASWSATGLQVTRTAGRYPLVTTQHHFSMEGRDPVCVLKAGKRPGLPADPAATLYPDWKPGNYSWGLSIDLNTCIGCNACVVACQAENNTPVVGKDQVSRGREMHWIRIDRYFDGDAAAPRILNQPVPCMHCENAPCEVVCPVAATVHSSEGLNQMVYNRCVGTRYCSNNCPYKVRRFNFLDYRSKADSPVNLQKNPDVTVRERGVMEKCTYCVQRINAVRIRADRENRPIADGEIRTACEQACPSEAIVFGNVADPESLVARRKREPSNYSLLGELNTRPRTTYLAKVVHDGPASA